VHQQHPTGIARLRREISLMLHKRPAAIGLIALGVAAGLMMQDQSDIAPIATLSKDTPEVTQASLNPDFDLAAELFGDTEELSLPAPYVEVPTADTLADTQPQTSGAVHTTTIASGDTLMDALTGMGVERQDAYLAIKALSKEFNPRHLKIGQQLEATFDGDETFSGLSLKLNAIKTALVNRAEDGSFTAEMKKVPVMERKARVAGTIETSLYEAMIDAGAPHGAIVDLIRIFSYDVDFQREIRQGDGFDILFEEIVKEDGTVIRTGKVLYGAMTVRGKEIALYRYEGSDGFVDYYKPDGSSAKKLLMRTPVDGARISSGFGRRRHPVLGYSKMHKGVDFAAPRGTPIMAAGDGVVDRANRYGSFGNYVRIRHAGGYKTAYAHLKGFGKGIKSGRRVRQGQIIGYIGTTGRSTGPHLHYEVHLNGKQTNPLSLKLPTGKKLAKADKAKFTKIRTTVDGLLASIQPGGTEKMARSDESAPSIN